MTRTSKPHPKRRGNSAATAFASWLTAAEGGARLPDAPVVELIRCSGIAINWSAAYRIARALGLKGRQRNHSRYDDFWACLNWGLPDTALAKVWGVDRGNLRNRRDRMGISPSPWSWRRDRDLPRFQRALARERRKAAAFAGAVPCSGSSAKVPHAPTARRHKR